MKYDLSVIVLKGYVLLPNNELKIDIKINSDVLESSELFNNNKELVVTDLDKLEETIEINTLPKYGTIARIVQKIELPNGLTRLTLLGISRAHIKEYINLDDIEAIVEELKDKKISKKEEQIIINKLNKELTEYMTLVPYVSNSFINNLNDIADLSIFSIKHKC